MYTDVSIYTSVLTKIIISPLTTATGLQQYKQKQQEQLAITTKCNQCASNAAA